MGQLRRMPSGGTGRSGLCEPGGFVAAIADAAEDATLSVATRDVGRVERLLEQHTEATRAEIVHALCYLVQSAKAAVEVAQLRGERLEIQDEEASAD